MTDMTESIASNFQDSFQQIQLELVVGKYMYEYTQANFDEGYEQYYDVNGGVEPRVYYKQVKSAP